MNLDKIEAKLESVPLDHVMITVVLHLVAYVIHIVWHCNLDNVIQLQIHATTMDPDQWPNVFHMKIKWEIQAMTTNWLLVIPIWIAQKASIIAMVVLQVHLRDTVVQETVCMKLVLKLVTIKMASLTVYAMKTPPPLHLANVITILSKETWLTHVLKSLTAFENS